VDTAFQRFRDAAEAYRRTLDELATTPDFPRRMRNAVARVYLAATFLPAGAGTTEEPAPRPEAVGLDEQLAELYDDLGRALEQVERASPGDLGQIRRDFEQRWGSQAVNVLRPLHRLAGGQ
jgi:Domain of unknown function (DUF5063)